ncbi:hypothetical protein [Aquabacterium sp.]|uniref:hypothetical protein n=1 Tax=Aquabacterium sp. TaxID=1872578 RepID=UPI002C21F60E|nr:hypothetical protein [Aquabacterium sp.]HSW05249.1 hypothetical protein [Aquabacterium sp.]
MTRLPNPHEAAQLVRLRGLRVRRARERCSAAQAEIDAAAEAVRARQRKIVQLRRDMEALSHAVVHALATQLPRWSGTVVAQRDKLADRLERDEYALIGDERQQEEAQEKLQQARAELTRAMAQEDAVRGLAEQSQRAVVALRERRVETELEDQWRAPAAALR